MIDMIDKTVGIESIECGDCVKCVTDDPDIFYCFEQRTEFPWHCGAYAPRNPLAADALGSYEEEK